MNALRLILILLGGLQIASATPTEMLAAGNAAYQEKDFGSAINQYESLLRRGETRPEIYYNLGLAYEKSANPGRAILSFERALLLSPSLTEAQAHLEALGSRPNHWWEQLPRVGSRASLIIGVCAAWIFILSLVAHWRILGNTRHLWSTLAMLSLLVFSVAAVHFYLREMPLSSPDRAIVLKNEKLRANFTASAPTVLSLKPGQAVQITSVNGPWTECRLADDTLGWVATASLERVIPQG